MPTPPGAARKTEIRPIPQPVRRSPADREPTCCSQIVSNMNLWGPVVAVATSLTFADRNQVINLQVQGLLDDVNAMREFWGIPRVQDSPVAFSAFNFGATFLATRSA